MSVLLSNAACLKHVIIPLDKDAKIEDKVWIVYLKTGIEYEGVWYLRVEKPKFEDDYLSGKYKNKHILIPLNDIDKVEAVRQDKQKIIRGTIIGVVVWGLLVVYGALLFHKLNSVSE